MLSELLMTAVQAKGRRPRPDRVPGLSCSSLFPCPYALYKVHTGSTWEEELTPQQLLNLEDGWFQEEQSIQILKEYTGIEVKDRQAHITVGRSNISGHIDGTVYQDKKRLWEHKAWGSSRFDWFISKGIDAFPGEKAQVNAYMLGMGLDECVFFVKRKETNDYCSPIIPLDKDYILPIINWADKIRLDGWIPEPQLTSMCAHCGLNCFGEVVDFSWIKEAKAPEMAEKWKQGKKFMDVGGMLMEEARTFFVGSRDGNIKGIIGDESLLLIDGLKIMKIISHRFDIKKELVLKEFGPEGLVKVGEEKEVTSYRITEEEE
jgi:hypothetical protein